METREGEKYREYCKTRKKIKSLIRKAKVEQEKSLARNAKENPKKFCEYAKSKMKVRQGIPDLDIPGTEGPGNTAEKIKDHGAKADTVIKLFLSAFTIEEDGEVL